MEEINRLHDIADDIASTSWGYELASALHNIAAGIGEKVDGMRHVGEYEDDVLTFVEAHGGLEEVKGHMIPEGFRWPLFEDNEPVRLGDHWHEDGFDGSITRIDSIEFAEDGVRFENEYADTFYRYGERVKRPTPKVLDADGAEIREGDTVWTTRDLDRFTVTNPNNGKFLSVSCKGEDGEDYCCYPTDLTHRAPVIAADGKPIREGERVWNTEINQFGTVEEIFESELCGQLVRFAYRGGGYGAYEPSKLTHERPAPPDSWERLEKDANKAVCIYFGVNTKACSECAHNSWECSFDKAVDLVRRSKALAERGQ